MSSRMYLLYVITILFMSIQSSAQNNTVKKSDPIAPEKLIADLDLMHDQLDKLHPGYYLYADEAAIQDWLSLTKSRITSPMTSLEFYQLVAPLVSLIADQHTNIEPSQELFEILDETALLFPFDVKILGEKLYITRNLSADKTIREGVEILTINGTNSSDLIAKLQAYVPRDGQNKSGMRHILSQLFMDYLFLCRGSPTFST